MTDYNTLIDNETKLIQELESSYPNTYKSTEWHIHHTKVRDAYWRRRMLITKRDGGNLNTTAQIY